MGNVRPTYIKRVAILLLEVYPQFFTEDFEHNKIMVGRVTDVSSKKMRNRIAGYLTTVRRKKPRA
jgi:small subunit ribosomal protein S17e